LGDLNIREITRILG